MVKYKNYKEWFVTKIVVPENQLEKIQKFINSELLKKYAFLLSKEVEILDLNLVEIHNKGIKVLYEYIVTIGYKDFEE